MVKVQPEVEFLYVVRKLRSCVLMCEYSVSIFLTVVLIRHVELETMNKSPVQICILAVVVAAAAVVAAARRHLAAQQ